MEVIRDIAAFPQLSHAVVTSGTFDGVHVGHQKILKRVQQRAQQSNGQSVVITYWPHPRLVLFPEDNNLKLLSTIDERIEQLRSFGIDYLLIIPFTKEFSRTSSRSFISDVLVRAINTKVLVIGYDHRFGKNREGSFEHLKARSSQYGFEVEEIPRQDVDDIGVSSTKIRKALESGDIETANRYLGRPYSLTSVVEEGDKLGRTIGFPTANLSIPSPNKLIPAQGVYAVWAKLGEKRYPAMMNIGHRPTVEGKQLRLEVHLLDFNKDLYGQQLTVEFVEHLRKEKKFDGLDALKEQLDKDKEQAKQALQS
ncbi:riboflavin kinase/FMN adenylyltransferase [Pontibacter ummariensis]|uniref:Riboflavin biosynthesis protein n=1 Tax=Pontibacter ummariensis TaxID=1610492 RepID=A0A239FC49_9BACT|nr:bifunctional riboflavin kinase/FAD synthetase [Pontibacter ummariensis]PRY12323.1 riboflavin kinase/FMN adenylyltransferase [Pontibacter ummariensis]SNS54469.1 riboflavin kinase / FMN adenylyltransferase [Pontibacter ummariensis]